MSDTLNRVVEDLKAREAKGIAVYGCTVDRRDLTNREWMVHAYEEALDLCMYLRRALDCDGDEG